MATTTSLLRETYGPRRRLVCAIDGLQHLIWQDDGAGVAPTRTARWTPDVTDIIALEPPDGELSWGIDIGEMDVKPSAMTIAFRNVDDPAAPTTKFFAKLFAPGRHAASGQKSCHLKRTTATDPYVLSSATTLAVHEDNSGWTTPALAYTARETFAHAAVTGSSFTGCDRGLFSCTALSVDTRFTPTYKVPDASDTTDGTLGVEISTVPYTWIGRRIALHVVAYDDSIDAWRTDIGEPSAIDSDILWIGRIQSIRYNGERGHWELGCEHITADLEEKICTGMPSSAKLKGINCMGPQGLKLSVRSATLSVGMLGATLTYQTSEEEIDAGIYLHHASVAGQVQGALNRASSASSLSVVFKVSYNGERYAIEASNNNADEAYAISIWASAQPSNTSHGCRCQPLLALGFRQAGYDFDALESGGFVTIEADEPPALAFHPIAPTFNDAKLFTDTVSSTDETELWEANASDYGTASATVRIHGVHFDLGDKPEMHYSRYNGKDSTSFSDVSSKDVTFLELSWSDFDIAPLVPYVSDQSFAAQLEGEEEMAVENVWSPHMYSSGNRWRGPFELLLYPLLSTGTPAANDATYDQLYLECSAGMDATLVDTTSFLLADIDIGTSELARRQMYVVGDGISWLDLLKRECKLFGYVLAWDAAQSKLSLRSVYLHDLDTYTETICDSNGTDPLEFPDADMSESTVINRWEVSILFDSRSGKYLQPVVIEDEDSIQQLRTAKTVKVEHPGVFLKSGTIAGVEDVLSLAFKQNRFCWRYPWTVVTKTLAPYLFNRISIGDAVLFTSSRFPDPYGGGTMTTSCYALVINLSWNPSTWTGKATLLLYSMYDADTVNPWAWSALISSWSAVNYRLTLVAKTWGDSADVDDAAEAAAGDYVDIIERAPADPTSEQKWVALEVASAYETDGANILTLAATTLTGWDAAKQYIVVPSVYSSAATTQKTENAFIGDSSTGLLGSDQPHRYG